MDVRKATDDLQQALQEAVKQTKKSDADAKDICQSIKDLEQAMQEVRTLAKLQAVEEVEEVQDGWQVTEADSKSGLTQEEVEALQATVASQQQALEDVQLHVLRDGLEELAQVVAAVRHAFGDSEAEVADLSRAREACGAFGISPAARHTLVKQDQPGRGAESECGVCPLAFGMLLLPAEALRRPFDAPVKRVDFRQETPRGRAEERSISPPMSRSASVASRTSKASNASGVLLGSCAIPRRKLVREHHPDAPQQLLEVYDMEEGVIGYGGYGTVRRAYLKDAPSVVRAIKTVSKRNLKAESFVRGEIRVLRRLDHPCICRLLETFEDDRAIYLVLELIDGRELLDEILEGVLSEAQASGIARQIFSALRYCHERRVMHRDLKPDNVMVQHHESGSPSSPEVKLIDFGLAELVSSRSSAPAGSLVGSGDYLAPEARQNVHLPASDVWSAGMVLHAMLLGFLPHWTEVLDFGGEHYRCLSSSARDLLQGLLALDASARLSAAQAARHPWTQGSFLEPRTPKDLTPTLTSFMAYRRSGKLRRAALAALATQLTSHQLRDIREEFLLVDANGAWGTLSADAQLTYETAPSDPMQASQLLRAAQGP
ncbi:unnamed protein product [Effrenium voratum]|nr:unnamed protein product [Effrenium voratum]